MFRLWSEWDIGEGDKIFATQAAGEFWLHNNEHVAEIAQADSCSVADEIQSCFEDGYFSWQKLEIIS